MPLYDNNPVLRLTADDIGKSRRIHQRTWKIVDFIGHIKRDGTIGNLVVWRTACNHCGGPLEVNTSPFIRIHTSSSFKRRNCPACKKGDRK